MVTLVTGGVGFVASNIVRALAERGHDVVSLDIAAPDDLARRYLEPWAARVTWVKGDIRDKAVMEKVAATHSISKIVHAAVDTSFWEGAEREHGRSLIDTNIGGTANLLDLAHQLAVERFLYVSSSGVYIGADSAGEPLKEDIPLNPLNLYCIAKYASELLTRRYGELHGFDTVSVRITGVYGPMERASGYRKVLSMMHEWTGKALRSEPIEVVPRPSMNYTYALDTATAICTVLDAPILHHQVYNISRGDRASVDELVGAFRQAYPAVKFMEPIPQDPPPGLAGYALGPLDPTRLQEDLGFVSQFDLVSGMREYIKWRQAYHYFD